MNKWRFVATEIDNDSYTCAKENVARNRLEQLITVKKTHTDKLLKEPLQDEASGSKFHFVMCNPPFFDNMSEADTNPETRCMGSANEMVFPGGEVAFIGSMIDESVELQDRILWFTSMVGRKSSLRKLLALLREKNVQSTRTTEFSQGRTKRWGIAWTYWTQVEDDPSAKVLGKRKEAHRRQEISFRVPLQSQKAASGCASLEDVVQRVREFVETKENLSLSVDSGDKAEENEDDQHWVMYRLEQRLPASGDNDLLCSGRIEMSTLDDSKEGFEVVVAFEEGGRAEFWTMVDMLQSATIRTSRQWRRKAQRMER